MYDPVDNIDYWPWFQEDERMPKQIQWRQYQPRRILFKIIVEKMGHWKWGKPKELLVGNTCITPKIPSRRVHEVLLQDTSDDIHKIVGITCQTNRLLTYSGWSDLSRKWPSKLTNGHVEDEVPKHGQGCLSIADTRPSSPNVKDTNHQ